MRFPVLDSDAAGAPDNDEHVDSRHDEHGDHDGGGDAADADNDGRWLDAA